MLAQEEAGAPGASLDELKDYLRIAGSGEDALLERLLRSATALCEQFIGQWLIVREARETVAADGEWHRLAARPVVEVLGAETLAGVALASDGWAADVDASGDGWMRARQGGLIVLRYRAGLAEDVDGLPEPIRQGIVRLAAEHFAARDGESAAPPAVVSALWRPWRRMRLA